MITTVEAHTGAEPFRIVTSGLPRLHGATIVQRRAWAEQHIDPLRTALMLGAARSRRHVKAAI
jgi:proline racemase